MSQKHAKIKKLFEHFFLFSECLHISMLCGVHIYNLHPTYNVQKLKKRPQKLTILLDIGSKKAVAVRVFLAHNAMMLSNISLVHFVIKF